MTAGDQTRAGDGGRSGTAGTDAGTSQAVMAAWQALGPLMDLATPMALRVAATLRLADFMPDDGTGEGAVLGDLAERPGPTRTPWPACCATWWRTGCSPSRVRGSSRPTRPPRCCAPAAGALWLDLDGFGGQMDLAFTGLAHTVRTGEPGLGAGLRPAVLGLPGRQPAISASFDATMAVDAGSAAVADGYDWTTVRHVADIGGGTGTLIAEVLRRNRELGHAGRPAGHRGPGPAVPGRARPGRPVRGRRPELLRPAAPWRGRLPARRIIHDWDDAAASAILRRAPRRRAARPGAGDRIAGTAERRPRRVRGDEPAHARPGRRPRAHRRGYSALAANAGLQVTAVHDITERHVIIECVPM